MKIIERNPVVSFAHALQRDLENGIWRSVPRFANQADGWVPSMDIHEESDRFVITADLPGLNSDDIEIFVEQDRLTVKGERKFERRVAEKDFGRFERMEGSFQRSFKLPENADLDQVSASNRDGVLEVVIKKQEAIPSRRIKIESKI